MWLDVPTFLPGILKVSMYFRHGKRLSVDKYDNGNWKLGIKLFYKYKWAGLAGAGKPGKLL